MADELWTVGHSNRSGDQFSELLQHHEIQQLVDVRRFPGSRRYPQFGREALRDSLIGCGITYRHCEALGGRRSRPAADSMNAGWRVKAFNAYADYMLTESFQAALAQLINYARQERTAIMCAEAVPWRCHRRLIADCLVARGWQVWDIISAAVPKAHTLPDFARVDDEGQLTYPGQPRLF